MSALTWILIAAAVGDVLAIGKVWREIKRREAEGEWTDS